LANVVSVKDCSFDGTLVKEYTAPLSGPLSSAADAEAATAHSVHL
jgi:hypothetical protein